MDDVKIRYPVVHQGMRPPQQGVAHLVDVVRDGASTEDAADQGLGRGVLEKNTLSRLKKLPQLICLDLARMSCGLM